MIKIKVLKTTPEDARHYVSDERAYTIKYEGLLNIFNDIIDWDSSSFPTDVHVSFSKESIQEGEITEVELRDYLGENPKLVPNILFEVSGQQFIFKDNESLIAVDSNTGILGINRVINELVLLEYKLKNKISYVEAVISEEEKELIGNNYSVKEGIEKRRMYLSARIDDVAIVESEAVSPDYFEEQKTNYVTVNLLDRLPTYNKLNPEEFIKFTVKTSGDDFLFSKFFILGKYRMYYNDSCSNILDEEEAISIYLSLAANHLI